MAKQKKETKPALKKPRVVMVILKHPAKVKGKEHAAGDEITFSGKDLLLADKLVAEGKAEELIPV